jgi:hypothetical protein
VRDLEGFVEYLEARGAHIVLPTGYAVVLSWPLTCVPCLGSENGTRSGGSPRNGRSTRASTAPKGRAGNFARGLVLFCVSGSAPSI